MSVIKTESVIIGAGPCGLFQVFELGLQGISTHVIDALPQVGGQCSALYPDKPIYDIPAIRVCNAEELVENLMQQIQPFGAQFHLDQQVTEVEQFNDDEFRILTSKETEFCSRSVIIAGGVGSFKPMPLRAKGAEQVKEGQLHYRITDKSQLEGKHLVILGGGDSALDWVLELLGIGASITLIHRSDNFRAANASVEKMRQAVVQGRMRFIIGNATQVVSNDGVLQEVHITQPNREIEVLKVDHLLVFFGLLPKLGPIAEWGLNLTKNQIETNTETFESNIPGIYAVGDIATYPGKKKLILSGFHEAALVSFAIRKRLSPNEKTFLQYTTTSPLMHERLGVDSS